MDMRLMDYISVDYEDLPCVRIVKDPTDGMVKYKLPVSLPPEGDNSDVNYLNNLLAVTPQKIEQFAEEFLNGDATPHLKSQHAPKNNPKDQGSVRKCVLSMHGFEVQFRARSIVGAASEYTIGYRYLLLSFRQFFQSIDVIHRPRRPMG